MRRDAWAGRRLTRTQQCTMPPRVASSWTEALPRAICRLDAMLYSMRASGHGGPAARSRGWRMSDEQHPQVEDTAGELAGRLTVLLDALGDRTALGVIPFAPAGPAPAPTGTPPGEIRLRADDALPAASLAKLPIAVELMRRADLGQFDLAERLETSAEPRVGGGGMLDYLDPGTQLTLADLCLLMLAVSDNTAANFLLDLVGMGEVNETMARLGFTQTHLARRFMDWEARAARRENLTSATDCVHLPALMPGRSLTRADRIRAMLAAQQVADDIRAWLPAGAALAHKTGELPDVFADAGILSGPGGACVFCVLTAEQPHLPTARE